MSRLKSANISEKIFACIEWAFFTNLKIICQTEARLKFTTTSTSDVDTAMSGATNSAGADNVTEEELRSCLVSEVADALKMRLEEEESKTKAELESLALVNSDLLDNQEQMEEAERILDSQIASVEVGIMTLFLFSFFFNEILFLLCVGI